MQAIRPNTGATEQRAIQSAQRGEADGLRILYLQYKDFVYHRCLRLTRNVASAEDLTQEVFLQLCRKVSTFKGQSSFKTWLYRVATNIVLMHCRKNKPNLVSLDQPASRENENARLGERLRSRPIQPDQHALLSQALSSVAPGSREILMLHDVEGYNHREIACLLGINSGTSKSQLHHARMKIRAIFLGADIEKRETAGKHSRPMSWERKVGPSCKRPAWIASAPTPSKPHAGMLLAS